MTCGIYKITNLVNGKIYVGQSRNIENRWVEHREHLRKNIHHNNPLQKSWNKYGEDKFIHEIIEECSIDELNDKEEYWIKSLDSIIKHKGYNLTTGGGQAKVVSDETRKKLSIASKNIVFTKERNEKISKALKGKTLSPEARMSVKLYRNFRYAIQHPDNWFKNKTYIYKGRQSYIGECNPYSTTTECQAEEIIKLLLDNVMNKDIAKIVGVSESVVSKIKRKEAWTYLTKDVSFDLTHPSKIPEEVLQAVDEDVKNGMKQKDALIKYNVSKSCYHRYKKAKVKQIA